MRAAVYARVSSTRQRDEQTIESQLRDVPAWVAAQGWEVVATYSDDGKSAGAGKLAARDGLARLVADAEAGRFDLVAVASVDRLTRSEDPVERAQIVASITATGCKLAVVGAGIQDPQTFAGDAYEHRLVAERKLGRRLLPGEQVHHIDENKQNNDPDNLEVVTIAEHRVHHRTTGVRRRMPGEPNPAIACACGCGESFAKFDAHGRPRRFVTGHNTQKAA